MFLNEMREDDLEKVINVIGFTKKENKKARDLLFPGKVGKGSVRTMRWIREYTWNKFRALLETDKEKKKEYISKAVDFHMLLPDYAKAIDMSLIK